MGEIDVLAKRYFGNPEVFADIFNILCRKEGLDMRAEELMELPSNVETCNVNRQFTEYTRDLLKGMTSKIYQNSVFVLLGLEHQSYVDNTMPLRCMHYDVLTFLQQCRRFSQNHKNTHGASLFFGDLRDGERLMPVLTAVVYVGSGSWNGPRCLRQMMEDVPSWMERYFNDYKMLLLTPEDITEEMLPSFNTDVGKALYYAKLSSDKDALSEYVRRSKLELSSEAVGLLNASLKCKIKIKEGTRRINMCKAWDDALAESKEDGKKEGIREGEAKGKAEGRIAGMAEGRIAGMAENEKEIANRIITYMRPRNTEEQIYDYLCNVIGISGNQARIYLSSRH